MKSCQLRVLGACLVGVVCGRWIAYGVHAHVLLPFSLGGLLVGWIAANVANATIFAEKPCEPI